MPIYEYTARDAAGQVMRGSQEADNEAAMLAILQNKGLYVTEISSSVVELKAAQKRAAARRHRRIRSEDMLFFVQQSANLLIAGIPFVRTLELIVEQTNSQKLYDTAQELMNNIREGSSYKDAIARHPEVFPEFWVHMIEAGEVSGTLPHVLQQIGSHLEASQRMRDKVISAMIYPSVLVTASVGVILTMMVFVIRTFDRVFKGFNAKLPVVTQAVLDISNFIRNYFLLIGAVAAILFYFLKSYAKTPVGKKMLQRFALNLPLFGSFARDVIHARISMSLGMLVRSGINFLKAIEITAGVSGNVIFETALNNIKLDVQAGKPFAASLKKNPLFSSMFVNLVAIGEESGKLPDMIDSSAKYYESRAEVFAARIGVLIEPLVLIVVGGIIGVVVAAMFMPILNLCKIIK